MRGTLAAILLAAAILCCHAQAHYPRPRRPERFDTAEQVTGTGTSGYGTQDRCPSCVPSISNYLKELQEYYSVHGRGRYGKRQMHIADASVIFRETPFFDGSGSINEGMLFKNLGYK